MKKHLAFAILLLAVPAFAQREIAPNNPCADTGRGLTREGDKAGTQYNPCGGFQISPLSEEVRLGQKIGSKVSGEITVTNQASNLPIAVLTSVTQLAVDGDGHAVPGPKATCLRISETSARLAGKQSHTFTWQYRRTDQCHGNEAFELLFSSQDARKLSNGLALRLSLGSAAYIMGEPLSVSDVKMLWTDDHTLIVQNLSDKLARLSAVRALYGDVWANQGTYALFPQSKVQINFEHPPTRVELTAEKLKLTADRQ